MKELSLLQWLGLGNITAVRGVAPAEPPAASYGRVTRVSEGRDAGGAMAELVGSACRVLLAEDVPVHAFGGAAALLGDIEGVAAHPVDGKAGLLDGVAKLLPEVERGLFVATPDSDGRPDAAVGPVGVARRLTHLDAELAVLLDQLPDDALVLLTGLGGNDATVAVREGATREQVPLLAYTPALPSGIDVGVRASLADVGATAAEVLGATGDVSGASFLGELLA